MSTQVTQRDEFECAYIFVNDEGRPVLNAHNYKIEVTVECNQRLEDHGYIMDFKKLKWYVQSVLPNNSFIYCLDMINASITEVNIARELDKAGVSTRGYDCRISAENLVNKIAEELQAILNRSEPGVTIVDVKLRENVNSFVSWKR